jgi:hypothetical protein
MSMSVAELVPGFRVSDSVSYRCDKKTNFKVLNPSSFLSVIPFLSCLGSVVEFKKCISASRVVNLQ